MALIVFLGCEEGSITGKPQQEANFKLATGETKEYPVWCDLIKSAEFIPLETTDASLVGEIREVIIWKDEIIIWDNANFKLLRFGRDGRFKNLIAEPGLSPGQYQALNDIYFDTLTTTLHCLDPATQKVRVFDLQGNFLRYGFSFEEHQLTPMSMRFFDEKVYAFTPPLFNKRDEYLIHKFNNKGTLENRFFPSTHPIYNSMAIENIAMAIHPDSGMLFFKELDDKIYRENEKGGLMAWGKLDIPGLSDEFVLNDNPDYLSMLNTLSEDGLTKGLEAVFFTDSLYWFSYAQMESMFFNIQDPVNGKTLSFNQLRTSPELCPYAAIKGVSENKFIGQVQWTDFPDPNLIETLRGQLSNQPKAKQPMVGGWLNAWGSRNETQDNPILALYELQLP